MNAFDKLILGYLSEEGYKKNSPDKNRPFNVIPSGNITMKNVEFPVLGQDNLGNKKIMQPGKDYKFPGNYVFEVPLKQQGGQFVPNYNMNPAHNFDAEGSDYDAITANKYIEQYPLITPKPSGYSGDYINNQEAYQSWVWHDKEKDYFKHSGSLDPKTGMILKGRKHPTYHMTESTEKEMGNEIVKIGNRYYSMPKMQKGGQADTLFVSNPNDSRLLAYNDSSDLYKYSKLQKNISGFDGYSNLTEEGSIVQTEQIYDRQKHINDLIKQSLEKDKEQLLIEQKTLKDNWQKMTPAMVQNYKTIIEKRQANILNPNSYVEDYLLLWEMGDKMVKRNPKMRWINNSDSPDIGHQNIKGRTYYSKKDHAINYEYIKPTQPVKYKKPEEPIFQLPPVTVYKPEEKKPLIVEGERTTPMSDYPNVSLVYKRGDNGNWVATHYMNPKGERIAIDNKKQPREQLQGYKEWAKPVKKDGGQTKWFIEDNINVLQNGGQQLFPVPELQSSKQDNTKAPAYLNDMPKSIEEKLQRDAMIEANRQKKIREKEAELKKHYSRTDLVSGMKTQPTDKEISQLAQQAVAYNEELEQEPIGVLGPDIALAVIPELMMFKGTQQAIGKIGKALNPFKESSPWKNKFKLINKFIPDENAYYRIIGDEDGLKDAIESRLLRPNQSGIFKDRHTWYSKGKPIDKHNRLINGNALNGTYYKGKYMAEVKPGNKFPEEATNLPLWNFGKTKSGQHISIDEPNVTLYKKDWLKGYKRINTQKLQDGGKVQWSIVD